MPTVLSVQADPVTPVAGTIEKPAPATTRPAEPTPEPAAVAEPKSSGTEECPARLAGTLDHVARSGHHLAGRFGVSVGSILGRAPRSGRSFHPGGRALDFMVDRETGDRLAEYALRNRDELGIIQVIWRQRINYGTGWTRMDDRGSSTANHMNHVHLSFGARSPAGDRPTC